MIKVALKGLAGRKVRALLTALAVVIGVSMVSGTFVLTDTMKKAFDGIFEESYAGTDAVIAADGTIPASLLTKVNDLPGVENAAGALQDFEDNTNETMLLDKSGEVIGRQGETLGVGYDDSGRQFSPLKLKTGQWAHGDHEVVIDAGTAAKHDFAVGDEIRVAGTGAAEPYKVTGVATFGSIDSLGSASIAVFDLKTAQHLYGKDGRFDAINVKARDGVSPEAVTKQIRPLLPRGTVVQTGDAQAAADAEETNSSLKFITYFLLGFGGIALFVGAFVILNTLSITVAQRSREFATLRTLGASRRQVLRSVVLEGLVVGLLASLLGLVAGVGIAKGMNALFVALGIDLPDSGMVFAGRTIVVSLLVGTLVTLVASIVPALRATRVPPISAVREGATSDQPAQRGLTPALITLAAALALLGLGLFAHVALALTLVLGVLTLFVAIAMLAPRIVKPLAHVVGLPMGRLARENAVRNPGRTASTAAALMIGLALVTVVATLGAGLRSSTEGAVKEQVHAAYVVIPKDAGGSFSTQVNVPGGSSVRQDETKDGTVVTGFDAKLARFYTFKELDGKLGGAVVTKDYAEEHQLKLGSTVLGVRVSGIYDPPAMDPLLGAVSLPRPAFDQAFPKAKNAFVFANSRPAIGGFPDAVVKTESAFFTSRSSGLSTILSMLYVLLGFSVVVSLFGMVNTLVLAVYERTRELGMLRAVGMTRRQARRMIRQESVITALIGAAMGIPLGLFLAALITQALSKYGVGFSLPITELVAFTSVAIVAGVLAAVIPARRASRIDVLAALQYE